MAPAPEPATELGRYRILASTAGVRVSPLCYGAMSLGTAWDDTMGSVNDEQAFKILDNFHEAGGNFIDTANFYQNEQSEKILGAWMKARDNRDLMFLATKYSTQYRGHELGPGKSVNFSGNHRKCMHMSVRDSLKKLGTEYIDLFYVHYWDWTTGIEEMMDALHVFVLQGKILYLGISDAPAWVVSAANTYATTHGKTPFSVYQGRWNILKRDHERDIIPMARHFGMALCPWDVLGSGRFQTRAQIEERKNSGDRLRGTTQEQTEDEIRASAALEAVAREHGDASIQQIALAYVLHKARNVFPMIGGKRVEHIEDNIKALSISLTAAQMEQLEKAKEFDIGFPLDMIYDDPKETGIPPPVTALSAVIDWQVRPRAPVAGRK
ncbi:aryl-alcohol dehydrogenase [Plectosphaerella cucumerina]|uniref:Aryl-alcohol dehydrogenase n=1 Tax=Plectosphaerella cucumerina TaxID=40658 RepID=A0A8K0T4Y9_9PEZI|nr:aryl-alcohol dehydrogenase [Plectosphaerella cucumerina]